MIESSQTTTNTAQPELTDNQIVSVLVKTPHEQRQAYVRGEVTIQQIVAQREHENESPSDTSTTTDQLTRFPRRVGEIVQTQRSDMSTVSVSENTSSQTGVTATEQQKLQQMAEREQALLASLTTLQELAKNQAEQMKDIQKTVLELQQEVASLRQLQETTQSESLDLSNANRTNPRVANETQDTKVEPSIPPQGEETAAPPVNTTNQSESAPQQTPVEEERQSSDIIAPTPQASENIATVVPTEQEEAKNPPTTSEQQPQTDTLANPAESTTPPVSEEITDTESDLPLVEQILQTNPDLDQRLTELSKEQGDSFNENDLFNYLIVRIKQHAEDLSSPLDLKRIADVTLAEIKKRREQQSHTTTIATPPIAIHEETPKQPSIEKQIDTTTPIPQEKSRETAPKIEAVREEPKEPAEVVQKEEVLTPAKAEQIAGPTPMISTETVPVKQPEQSYPRPKEALVASVNPDQKEIQEDLPLISQVLTHYPDLQQKLIELSGTNLDTYTNSMLFDALLVQIAQKYSIQDISKMPELRNRISNVMLVEIKRRREQRNNHPIVSSQPLATEISQSAPTERAMSATPQVTTERAKAPEGILGRVRGLFSRRSQVQPKS